MEKECENIDAPELDIDEIIGMIHSGEIVDGKNYNFMRLQIFLSRLKN